MGSSLRSGRSLLPDGLEHDGDFRLCQCRCRRVVDVGDEKPFDTFSQVIKRPVAGLEVGIEIRSGKLHVSFLEVLDLGIFADHPVAVRVTSRGDSCHLSPVNWRFADELGKPILKLSGQSKKFIEEHQISSVHVSLSHLKEIAVAVVILEI